VVEARDTYTHKAQKDNHQCPEKDNDCCKDCSPFYVCGRCTGFTVTKFKLFISAAVTIRPIVQNGIYLSAELPQILIPIWQPPQLS